MDSCVIRLSNPSVNPMRCLQPMLVIFLRFIAVRGYVSRWTRGKMIELRGDRVDAYSSPSSPTSSSEAVEEEDEDEPCVIVVDPMDFNGQYFMSCLQDWGVEPIVVLSPGVAAAIGSELSHLAAPPEGAEKQWAAERNIDTSPYKGHPTSPQTSRRLLGVISESDAGIETALRLEEVLLERRRSQGGVGEEGRKGQGGDDDDAEECRSSGVNDGGVDSGGGCGGGGKGGHYFGNGRSATALRWKHETVNAAAKQDLRTPLQTLARSWSEAEAFLVNKLGMERRAMSSPLSPLPPLPGLLSSSLEEEATSGVEGWKEEEEEEDQHHCRHHDHDDDDDDNNDNVTLRPPSRAVLKPFRGAASMDVFAVSEVSNEARNAFHAIKGSPSHGGTELGNNDEVLVQEYLHGDEFAVDTVSLNGEHKVCAVWKYDKRAVNGCRAPTVYFGTFLCSLPPANSRGGGSDGVVDSKGGSGGGGGVGGGTIGTPEELKALAVAEYACKVLTACGMKDGPAHTEVKWVVGTATADGSTSNSSTTASDGSTTFDENSNSDDSNNSEGPVIVEVNGRWHATNFGPLVDECLEGTQQNALDATALAMLAKEEENRRTRLQVMEEERDVPSRDSENKEMDDDSSSSLLISAAAAGWHAMPARYGRLSKHGRIVHLVSYVRGELVGLKHQDELRLLPSVASVELSVGVGGSSSLTPTVDISSTDCGCIRLVHENPLQVEADYRRIVEHLMPTMFVVE